MSSVPSPSPSSPLSSTSTPPPSHLVEKIRLFRSVLRPEDKVNIDSLVDHFTQQNGDFDATVKALEENIKSGAETADPIPLLRIVHSLANITDDNPDIVNAIRSRQPEAKSLRDIALGLGKRELTDIVSFASNSAAIAANVNSPKSSPRSSRVEERKLEQVRLQTTKIRRHLFAAEPTAVLQRMLVDDEVRLPAASQSHIPQILAEDSSFDIRVMPVISLLANSKAFEALPDTERPKVEADLRTLQRVQALTPVPDAIPALLDQNLVSALNVSKVPQASFIRSLSATVGDESIAAGIHQHAVASTIRNEHFLISTLQSVRGSGLRVIDGGTGKQGVERRIATFVDSGKAASKTQVDLSKLFGSLDYCECSECGSVYSPASYFVELLEFLRHNNLSSDNTNTPTGGTNSLRGTQLEQLFLRRPDLMCIELSCENTNTLIPYIDLALEVMESYVVHAPLITAYNVRGETSNELLSEPQHTNKSAYEILRRAPFPLRLPYHLPIDTMRVFLEFLGTSRAQILDLFRPSITPSPAGQLSAAQEAAQRSHDAEFNFITQEEYVILTKQGFWPQSQSSCHRHSHDNGSEAYRKSIDLLDPEKYFGYDDVPTMLDDEDNPKIGLTWVKAQFLPRAGIQYTDLVSLVQTRYINPNMPTGRALVTMEKIRFSYRFLSLLIHRQYTDKRRRYELLVKFLSLAQPLIPLVEWALKKGEDDPCASNDGEECGCGDKAPPRPCECCCSIEDEWRWWVHNWFEKLGSLIVLESGEGPRLPIRGVMFAEPYSGRLSDSDTRRTADTSTQPQLRLQRRQGPSSPPVLDKPLLIGNLNPDGSIISEDNNAVGLVTSEMKVVDVETGKPLAERWSDIILSIYPTAADVGDTNKLIGYVNTVRGGEGELMIRNISDNLVASIFYRPQWSSVQDTCDLEKVRIVHLDGTTVSPDEYDKMQRFLRLWMKLGWTVEEIDQAIQGLGDVEEQTSTDSGSECDDGPPEELDDHEDLADQPTGEINVALIHNLVAVKKLLELTGFALPVLLTFWSDIPTREKSLYSTTFLTHNLIRMDPVFQPDADGNYLTVSEKISDHMIIIQTALQLKAEDILLIRNLRNIPDVLSLSNVSELFRFSKLAKYLGIRVSVLPDFLAVFKDPFKDADTTLDILETWQKISESAFSFAQLNFIIRGQDNISHPLSPTVPQVLRLAKTLFDGLTDIDRQYPDVSQADVDDQRVNLVELIPSRIALVYDPALAQKINDIINGTYAFTTNAPAGLIIKVPETLSSKVKYVDSKDATPPRGQLTVTGILTEDESAETIALSADTRWAKAIERVKKQAKTFYTQSLATLFPEDGATIILTGDTPETRTAKGLYFLKYFMPYLRAQLAIRLVQTTISDSAGLAPNLTSYLLSIIKTSSGETALSTLLGLKSAGGNGDEGWSGILIPSTTEMYSFVAIMDSRPKDIVINGKPISFPHQSEDPSDVWSSDPIRLVAGTLYQVHLPEMADPTRLSWKTSIAPETPIPTTAVLPNLSSDTVKEVLTALASISLVIQGFNLSLDEVVHFYEHRADFPIAEDNNESLKLEALTLGGWKRLLAYVNLRDKLPKQPTRLIDLFYRMSLPEEVDVLEEIKKVTLWNGDKVREILTGYGALDRANFKNETVFVAVGKALAVATKTAIDVPSLFEWAKPLSTSDKSYQILVSQATAIRNAVRARYTADSWEKGVKTLYDKLRLHQRDALVAYLVVEKSLVATGMVHDADGLFEYFLIDCQMSSCLQTSRIKQAIATIHLYVQRCLLGLEEDVATVESNQIDRKRWDWMKRYRVWEANRQVYLYPENWIVPSLRDDKSPFFLDLESQLMQKDISMANAAETLKSYLYDVASVANLKVYGLFVQKETPEAKTFGVHIVARRMNAPYDWYSRDYSADGLWSPWVKMTVDIPNYEVDDSKGNRVGSGTFVSPFLWQGRPVLFFLQMLSKQVARTNKDRKPMGERFGSESQETNLPLELWEIRLGYSMFENGKWTQKKISQAVLRDVATKVPILNEKTKVGDDKSKWETFDTYPIPLLSRYQMVPRYVNDSQVRVDIKYQDEYPDPKEENTLVAVKRDVGYFVFMDGGVTHYAKPGGGGSFAENITSFHYSAGETKIFSFQALSDSSEPAYYNNIPSVTYPSNPTTGSKVSIAVASNVNYTFNHTFIDPLLKHISTSNNITDMYEQFALMSPAADTANDDPFGKAGDDSYNELKSPNALYNWEIGLHAPMALIDSLHKAQQFDDALAVCHTIFDPSEIATSASQQGSNQRFWKFFPFKKLADDDAKATLEQSFLMLQPQRSNAKITEWRKNPFAPHVVARGRPVAYMKWIAMKYIEIMISYGDYYFRQNSLETIPNAIQCYVIASHVYGPRGQKIPKRGKTKIETYASLLNRWDAFGNAIVQLEVAFPFSNQTSLPLSTSNGVTGFANIFGFASSLYFCIPDNPKLRQLRDTIDDRLFKIRNCMDINGVHRSLALWDPPIDPALLVQATAQGMSLDSVLNDISGPIPNYRFQMILQKAFEICAELRGLGAALLAAKEKRDGEELAMLRATHETVISDLTLDIKNRQLDEANKVLEQLQHSRESPAYRLQFFKYLVGVTDGAPGETDDFVEIPNPTLSPPVQENELLLIAPEQEEVQKNLEAQNYNIAIGILETLAGIFHMFPDTKIDITPFGIGTGLKFGGSFLGSSTTAVAKGMQVYSSYLTSSASNAGRRAGFLRALQDRIYQANTVGKELKNIDKSIATQRIRVSTAEQEIKNQEKTVSQIAEVEEYLRTKYTNTELYIWMEGMTKTLYQQAYSLAYDLAKRAEKAYSFERPQESADFIRMGYWSNARDGLLAGEQLYQGLKHLEAAYQEKLGYDFEVTKHVSIRQWAPASLLEFRQTGMFEVFLPEILFDMDFPGHYMRRIRSVAVTIPCVVGPYTCISCTLRLLQHTIRTSPRAASKADYPQKPSDDGDDDRFSILNVPINAIAISTANNDAGRHEVSLSTERYMPFEGAGVVSSWRFEMPAEFRAFDYESITDVIMHIKYTSLDGGDKLKTAAAGTVADYVKMVREASTDGGLVTMFDLRNDFPSEWYAAFRTPVVVGAAREMKLNRLYERLPAFTKGTKPAKLVATGMAMLGRGSLNAGDVSIELQPDGAQTASFTPGVNIKDLVGLVSEGIQMPMTDWTLKVSAGLTDIENLWLVVRYSMT